MFKKLKKQMSVEKELQLLKLVVGHEIAVKIALCSFKTVLKC